MTQPAKVQEPSMEEILASIRRIIADDEAAPPKEQPAAEPPAAASRPATPSGEQKKVASLTAATPAAPASRPQPVATKSVDHAPQDDVDELLAGLDADTLEDDVRSGPDVLELTEQMAISEPRSFKTVDAVSDIEFAETDDEPEAPPVRTPELSAPRPPHVEQPEAAGRPLLSQATMSAVDSAFNSLAQTVLVNNARTLEDLVREMLRPMLKNWLDDNLPGLVEKIVRAEIERVSRGR